MKGGYFMTKINANLSETNPQTIKGAYNVAKKAIESEKVIVVYGLKYGEKTTTPICFFGWIGSNGVILNAGRYSILISEDDRVVVRNIQG